jgi:hypothetical protein
MKGGEVQMLRTIALFGFAYASIAAAQDFRIVADGPRPLASAVRQVREKYGWPISYEDPQYSGADVVDKTASSYKGPQRALGLREGHIDVPVTGTIAPRALLTLLIADHEQRHNPGHFKFSAIGNMLVVMPVQGTVLDTPISLPAKDRNMDETLFAMAQSLTDATGVHVGGPAVAQGSPWPRFQLSADHEPARNILLRAFQAPAYVGTASVQKQHLKVWELLYAPNYGYVINVSGLSMRVASPDGTPSMKPVEANP